MCMIAYVPAGKGALESAVIDTAMTRHSDGFGIMWRTTDEGVPTLHTASFAPHQRSTFRVELARVMALGGEYAVHFRMATSGPKTGEMAHPFVYTDPDPAVGTVAIMHNGIIGIAHDRAKESDTSAFVRQVLATLPTRWWTSPALVYLVGEAIGYSKLTIMTAHEAVIIGESRGEWEDDKWYSSAHRPTASIGSNWTRGADGRYVFTDDKGGKVIGTPANPNSKRSQKRAAKAAARAKAKGLTTQPENKGEETRALVAVNRPVIQYPGLRHAGHDVALLTDAPLDTDADYVGGVVCEVCRTVGDVYVIDGQRFMDLGHITSGSLDDRWDDDWDGADAEPVACDTGLAVDRTPRPYELGWN